MDKLNMNAPVSYSASNDAVNYGVGGSTLGGSSHCIPWDYWHTWPNYIERYYPVPTYIETTRYKDVYQKAFKIAKLLLKKDLLKKTKVKDFIGLVEEIASHL